MTAALTPILPDAHATARRILAHINSGEPKTYGADVEEPADTEPEYASAWECEAAARDMVWPVGS